MTAPARSETAKQVRQHNDSQHGVPKEPATTVPVSWKLTPQQQAFIDVFADDEPKKQ